ncbi:MAG: 23S rRNA (adenine(2503)-C(2))-methyltransferase RlmN [Firmicutes bacterium]|nr:23S rRNA (adenine(2503)-C(2))-methyltransferase RlmN [Bacillota bacterium]
MDISRDIHIVGMFPEEIELWLQEHHEATFRSGQVFSWLHRHCVQDFSEMTNVPQATRELLTETFDMPLPLQLVITRTSVDGTEKYLFRLLDGATIETVLIPEYERDTICISTQVGCAMNCSFCATGRSGYLRNLTAAEIVAQVLWVQARLKAEERSITNVVYMGMGEPLANYHSVLRSVRLLNYPQGLNLGARRLTISTCGLVPQIKALAEEDLQVNLAVSLHAVDDIRRSEIMPVNRRFPIHELLASCDYYTERTGRRVSYEYALISGFNDTVEQAEKLKDLLKGKLCHVNLIPINPVGPAQRPSAKRILDFTRVLEKSGIAVSVRKERGTDIEAACGQLRQSDQRGETVDPKV